MANKNEIENKEQFINDNIGIVPKLSMKRFKLLDIDEQVDRILQYQENQRLREEFLEKNRVVNKMKALFEKRHGNVEDAKDCITFLQEFIDGAKQREIEKLDEEIAKLQNMKKSLEAK